MLQSDIPSLMQLAIFFFQASAPHRDLHSFPTRRSSDLERDHGRRAPPLLRRLLQHGAPHAAGSHRPPLHGGGADRKSTRLNSSHMSISYAVFCLKKKKQRSYSPVLTLHMSPLQPVDDAR